MSITNVVLFTSDLLQQRVTRRGSIKCVVDVAP